MKTMTAAIDRARERIDEACGIVEMPNGERFPNPHRAGRHDALTLAVIELAAVLSAGFKQAGER